MCQQMREWNESLPSDLPAPIRELFDLELRYSYVYCLAPSPRAPQLTDYTRTLILEHVVSYMTIIHDVTHRKEASTVGFFTYHDSLRVYFLATQLMTILNDDGCENLLAGVIPQVPYSRPGSISAPPLPRRQLSTQDNVTRSLQSLNQAIEVLRQYGQRWENALQLRDALETGSADTRKWLETRQQMIQQQQSSPQPRHQQQQQQQQQYPIMAPPPPQGQVPVQMNRSPPIPGGDPRMPMMQNGMPGPMGPQYQWYQ